MSSITYLYARDVHGDRCDCPSCSARQNERDAQVYGIAELDALGCVLCGGLGLLENDIPCSCPAGEQYLGPGVA